MVLQGPGKAEQEGVGMGGVGLEVCQQGLVVLPYFRGLFFL